MPYAIINKIRMHYEVSGQGAPVLLINGLSAPAVGFVLQVKALAPHFQVVTFDNRGVGETDLPPDPLYTTAQMADDAAALLRHLKLPRAHVLGASMGGTIAMELPLRHPPLVPPRPHSDASGPPRLLPRAGGRFKPRGAAVPEGRPLEVRGELRERAAALSVSSRAQSDRTRPRRGP